jgi:hypothetical protein
MNGKLNNVRPMMDRELAMVLAALRDMQHRLATDPDYQDYLSDGDHFDGEPFEPMTVEEIDVFCEQLNLDGVYIRVDEPVSQSPGGDE